MRKHRDHGPLMWYMNYSTLAMMHNSLYFKIDLFLNLSQDQIVNRYNIIVHTLLHADLGTSVSWGVIHSHTPSYTALYYLLSFIGNCSNELHDHWNRTLLRMGSYSSTTMPVLGHLLSNILTILLNSCYSNDPFIFRVHYSRLYTL